MLSASHPHTTSAVRLPDDDLLIGIPPLLSAVAPRATCHDGEAGRHDHRSHGACRDEDDRGNGQARCLEDGSGGYRRTLTSEHLGRFGHAGIDPGLERGFVTETSVGCPPGGGHASRVRTR